MPLVKLEPTDGWVEIATTLCTIQNHASSFIEAKESAGAPLDTDTGYILSPLQIEQFAVDTGKELYVRAPETASLLVEVA